MKKILVTGSAGFIGFHFTKALLEAGYKVVSLDNLNDYYEVELKKARLAQLCRYPHHHFYHLSLEDRQGIEQLFFKEQPEVVVHLAAQAGVRYSIDHPYVYGASNLIGFLHILEGCRHLQVRHLIFASSSSVYGLNKKIPFSPHHTTDHPQSLYGATKKANELMAHSYSYLYGIPTTGLRFFTVYGPWGRPDMAYFKFARCILQGKPITVYGKGTLKRDFTYIDDVVESMKRLLLHIPKENPHWDRENPDPATSSAPYQIYNVGNHTPVEVNRLVELLEKYLGKKAIIQYAPPPKADVEITYADIQDLHQAVGFSPKTPLEEGLRKFVDWFLKWEQGSFK